MPIRLAINGFGRIGRTTLKVLLANHPNIDIVAINDLTDTATLAHLLKYDSVYRTYDKAVLSDETHLIVDGKKISVFAEKEPSKLPWKKLNIDVVIESTGRFTDEVGMRQHLIAGAKRVVLSAPAKGGNVPTHVLGVNNDTGKSALVNGASCTTNCITPVIAVLNDAFGIKKAMMTTVHAITAEQNIVDAPPPGLKKGDLRRARAAAQNIVPTTTGATIATTEVVPSLKGLFGGMSLRVPVPVGSLSDFSLLMKKNVTVEQVNDALTKAAKSARYKGILAVTNDPVVSSDCIGNAHSAIVDLALTNVVDGDFVKVVAWYDNEWGYSNRLAELAERVGKSI